MVRNTWAGSATVSFGKLPEYGFERWGGKTCTPPPGQPALQECVIYYKAVKIKGVLVLKALLNSAKLSRNWELWMICWIMCLAGFSRLTVKTYHPNPLLIFNPAKIVGNSSHLSCYFFQSIRPSLDLGRSSVAFYTSVFKFVTKTFGNLCFHCIFLCRLHSLLFSYSFAICVWSGSDPFKKLDRFD